MDLLALESFWCWIQRIDTFVMLLADAKTGPACAVWQATPEKA